MKKLLNLLILFGILLISCSKNEDNEPIVEIIPDYYTVRYEISGTGQAYNLRYTIEPDVEYFEQFVDLPFTKEISYRTKKDGDCEGFAYENCASWHQVRIEVYEADFLGNVDEVRLYIDDELVDKDDTPPNSTFDNAIPWSCDYNYAIRGDL